MPQYFKTMTTIFQEILMQSSFLPSDGTYIAFYDNQEDLLLANEKAIFYFLDFGQVGTEQWLSQANFVKTIRASMAKNHLYQFFLPIYLTCHILDNRQNPKEKIEPLLFLFFHNHRPLTRPFASSYNTCKDDCMFCLDDLIVLCNRNRAVSQIFVPQSLPAFEELIFSVNASFKLSRFFLYLDTSFQLTQAHCPSSLAKHDMLNTTNVTNVVSSLHKKCKLVLYINETVIDSFSFSIPKQFEVLNLVTILRNEIIPDTEESATFLTRPRRFLKFKLDPPFRVRNHYFVTDNITYDLCFNGTSMIGKRTFLHLLNCSKLMETIPPSCSKTRYHTISHLHLSPDQCILDELKRLDEAGFCSNIEREKRFFLEAMFRLMKLSR